MDVFMSVGNLTLLKKVEETVKIYYFVYFARVS